MKITMEISDSATAYLAKPLVNGTWFANGLSFLEWHMNDTHLQVVPETHRRFARNWGETRYGLDCQRVTLCMFIVHLPHRMTGVGDVFLWCPDGSRHHLLCVNVPLLMVETTLNQNSRGPNHLKNQLRNRTDLKAPGIPPMLCQVGIVLVDSYGVRNTNKSFESKKENLFVVSRIHKAGFRRNYPYIIQKHPESPPFLCSSPLFEAGHAEGASKV